MRYVAKRPLTLTGPDGAIYSLLPGEAVPGFEEWTYAVKQAHLRLETVVDTHSTRGVLCTEGGRLHLRVFGMVSPPTVDVADLAPEAELPIEPEPLAQSMPNPWACDLCDHPGFTNRASLAKHVQRKHSSR